jgi:hypothetical protein
MESFEYKLQHHIKSHDYIDFFQHVGGIIILRRRMGDVVVEDGLEVRAKKNMHSHKIKIHFSKTTWVRSRLAYLENASFSYVYDLLRLNRAHDKEHKQKRKHLVLYF